MWHKARMEIRDSITSDLKVREIEIECPSIEHLLGLLATELLGVYDGSASPHLGHLRGCLHVAVELTTWDSSSGCAAPGEAALQRLHAMRTSATTALSFGSGSPRLPTPMGRNGCCPK